MAHSPAGKWKQWLAENGPRLLLFARGWAPTREDAEDLVQEAIVRMWNHQQQHGAEPPDLPLVFSTIRFCGLNHHRSETRRRKREESVIYLNDFQDVWLDPVLEDDEEAMIAARDDGSFVVDARTEIDDVTEAIGEHFQAGEYGDDADSIGGLIFAALGRVPARGEVVQAVPGFEFDILDADPRRIRRVRIRPTKSAERRRRQTAARDAETENTGT